MRMPSAASEYRLHFSCMLPLLLCLVIAQLAVAQKAESIDVQHYSIDVVLNPAQHSIAAQAAVTFTALEDLAAVSFQLHPALRVSGIKDFTGRSLSTARTSEDEGAIRVTPSMPLRRGETVTWTFTYDGVFDPHAPKSIRANNAAAVQLASIGDPASYLLYAAHWFPMVGYLTDRFTATMHIHVPVGERVLGSGFIGTPHLDKQGWMVFDFEWPRPGFPQASGFPGTIIAGKFRAPYTSNASPKIRVYLLDNNSEQTSGTIETSGQNYAATANQEYSYFAAQFGATDSGLFNVVELPDDTVPAYWAPEIAAIAGRQMRGEGFSRLLANTIAHQWWGNAVSPATLNDAWITNGMCRYSELEYLEHASGQAAFSDAVLNISASALAYDTVPLAEATHYASFSPEFQAMTYDKGAMILRMLQWQIGDRNFQQTLHEMLGRTGKSISSAEVEQIAEAASRENLRPFFTQWLDSTGAPTFEDNWTLYRLGNNKGFRTVGEINQDLDLFRMPVDVRVEMEGKTVSQRVEVVGTQSQYAINSIGVPRNISLDPDRWLLRSDPDMQVRVYILRGQNLLATNNSSGAIQEYRRALDINSVSSLASYRLGEVYFQQRNYQAAADAFRDALHGDDVPKWTEVWSDLALGRIFDASGQRDRALNQYREALQTQDDTGGALELARGYLQHAYQP